MSMNKQLYPSSRRRAAVAVCLMTCVMAAAATIVQSAWAQSGSFSPQSPSKEYIYAGGRLVATEEPTFAAPTNLRVGPSVPGKFGSSSPLLWNDNSSNETGFKIERQQVSGGNWTQSGTVQANVTSYSVGTFRCGSYRVRAMSAVVDSAPSNVVTPSRPCFPLYDTGGDLQVESIEWTYLVGATASTNNLYKAAGTYAWDAGAISTRTIASGDGYVEFTPGETGTSRMCGLGNGDTSAFYADIEYAFFLESGGGLYVYEAGTYRGNFGSYAATDTLAVVVSDGVVKYFKNGTLLYTSAAAPQYPLLADASLSTPGAAVTAAKIAANSFPALPTVESVTWTNVFGTVTANGNELYKASGAYAWDSGAVSAKAIETGDGYVEFTPGETGTSRMCGLGGTDTSQYYTDIEYAFFMESGGGLYVYEAGVNRGSVGTYTATGRLRVAVEGGVVKYYRGGTLVYTSGQAPPPSLYPLRVDTSLNTVGAYVGGVVISGTLTP